MTARVRIHKLDDRGREVLVYEGRIVARTGTSLTAEAFFALDRVDVDHLTLRKGDRMVETFYSDRWYNVFAVHEGETGRLKAWYCNIARPARIVEGHIYQEDLALDLVVYPDRTWTVLDMDEFNRLSLAEKEQREALEALRSLQAAAQAGRGPFSAPDPLGGAGRGTPDSA